MVMAIEVGDIGKRDAMKTVGKGTTKVIGVLEDHATEMIEGT